MDQPSADEKTIYVLGAGFSRAFVEKAPLMAGFLSGREDVIAAPPDPKLPDTFRPLREFIEKCGMQTADLNIETLYTLATIERPWAARLDAISQSLIAELVAKLIADVVWKSFPIVEDESKYMSIAVSNPGALEALARTILRDFSANVISFNYDSLFENALAREQAKMEQIHPTRFNIDYSYGFSGMTLQGWQGVLVPSKYFLFPKHGLFYLKLHGSTHWFPRKLHGQPVFPHDVLVLSTFEKGTFLQEQQVFLDLEHPFIVPPILDKSAVLKAPILSLLWGWAADLLSRAKRVIFLGYSFPITDYYSEFLFRYYTRRQAQITVVDLAKPREKKKREAIKNRYGQIFPGIASEDFHFDGVAAYCARLEREPHR
jgi:hypothetical protein